MPTKILDTAPFYQSYELIGGKKFMAPSANLDHSGIIARLAFTFSNYFVMHKNGYVYLDNVDVHLSEEDTFIPDLSVVLKEHEQILARRKAIYGAPDMVVEVLSHSTRKNDLTVKKDTYEAQGVREYWIVDPRAKSVTVYLLKDGKYFLDEVYTLMSEEDLILLDEDEKANVKYKVPVSIVEGLEVPIEFIFSWGY